MSDGDRNQGMIIAVIVLAIAVVVVLFLWQRDQESKDLKIDIDAGGSSLLDEGATQDALALRDHPPVRLAPAPTG